VKKLLLLAPQTLGASAELTGALTAIADSSRKTWRVTWTDPTGKLVQAESAFGSTAWSSPAPAADSTPPSRALPPLSGGAFPEGILVWQQLSGGCAALRSGRRVVGRAPRFPAASLVLCGEQSGVWRDLAFADETPELEIGSVALAVTPTFWLAAYLTSTQDGRRVCRVVEMPTAPPDHAPDAWKKLPDYPHAPGMAGMMTGSHRGVLIAAGGANFPDLKPWENGKKRMYDEIYVLLPGEKTWSAAGRLPAPRAYGATVSLPDGVLIAGGESADTVYADTLLLQWDGTQVQIKSAPPLPEATTCAVAAVLDGSVYLSGGYAAGTPRLSRNFFWRLTLSDSVPRWHALPSWPGPTRALAVSAAVDGALYVMSGIDISAAEGKTPPEAAPGIYLRDAFRYRPGSGWEKLPDLPWSAIAAPSPAPVTASPPRVFVLGGVDGRQVGNLPRTISLPDDILYFDVALHQWKQWPEAWPLPVVCLCAVETSAGWVMPSGEIMAGHRTTETWAWTINR
jgi:N-acetylneuraminic acid mutarotase